MNQAKHAVEIRDFMGIELQSDAHDLEPGKAVDQVNIRSDQAGSMAARAGFLAVSFDGTTYS